MYQHVRLRFTSRLAVYRQSFRLGVKLLETHDQYFFNWRFAVIVLMWHPLWWEDGSAVCNCCWASSAQSFWDRSPKALMTTLLSQIRDSPNLEGQVPVFIFPQNRVVQLYPQALSALFFASYDSQGYSGDILSLQLFRYRRPGYVEGK
jgi:hypothetical protein